MVLQGSQHPQHTRTRTQNLCSFKMARYPSANVSYFTSKYVRTLLTSAIIQFFLLCHPMVELTRTAQDTSRANE